MIKAKAVANEFRLMNLPEDVAKKIEESVEETLHIPHFPTVDCFVNPMF